MIVLLIDDDSDQRRILRRLLERVGVEVDEANSGTEGVRRALAHPRPDLILLDVDMPRLDGPASASLLRAGEHAAGLQPAHVVGVTAHLDDDVRARALAAGMNTVLEKPLRLSVLTALVNAARTDAITTTPTSTSTPSMSPTPVEADLIDIVPGFLAARRQELLGFCDHLEPQHHGEIARIGHRLCGTAGILGFAALAAAGRQLEQAARTGDLVAVRSLLTALVQQIDDLNTRGFCPR